MTPSTEAPDRRWLALALLCTVQFVVVLDISAVRDPDNRLTVVLDGADAVRATG